MALFNFNTKIFTPSMNTINLFYFANKTKQMTTALELRIGGLRS